MVSAKDVINSIKPNIPKVPRGQTQKGSAGYDNVRDDIERIKSLREGDVQKVPVNAKDIVNKEFVDTLTTNHPHQDVQTTASPTFVGGTFTGDLLVQGSYKGDNSDGIQFYTNVREDHRTDLFRILDEAGSNILMQIDTTDVYFKNKVGIGTTSPQNKLEVNIGATTDFPLKLVSSNKFLKVGALNANYVHFDTNTNLGFYFYDPVTLANGLKVLSGDIDVTGLITTDVLNIANLNYGLRYVASPIGTFNIFNDYSSGDILYTTNGSGDFLFDNGTYNTILRPAKR